MSAQIKNISILGLGLIGGSISKALKKTDLPVTISAYDKPEVLSQAKDEGIIDNALYKVDEILNSELIFICLPVELSLQYLKEIAPMLSEGQIISDVSGVKGVFQDEWERLDSKGLYIGGHPMTGKEKGGYESSDPLLFENAVYILSNKAEQYSGADSFIDIISSLGARIIFLDPYLHDKVVANVSHLPQLLSVALVNNSAKNEKGINFTDFAAGGFRDMTRIASSDFSIWENIMVYNKDKILSALDAMKLEINEVKKLVEKEDLISLEEKFESSRVKRDEIPKDTKGFIHKLYDIFVFVKDEPGVISKISTALFNNNINIKDIELLKIREGTGGTFRLSFESESEAKEAGKIITEQGFVIK